MSTSIWEKYLKIKNSGSFKRKVARDYNNTVVNKKMKFNNDINSNFMKETQIINKEFIEVSNSSEQKILEQDDNNKHQDIIINEHNVEQVIYGSNKWLTELNESDENNAEFEIENEQLKNLEFCEELRQWSTEFATSHKSLKTLINIINTRYPKTIGVHDPRTFLKTPQTIVLWRIGENGEYWHQGLKYCLQNALTNIIKEPMTISLNFNLDGLPTCKSSKIEFWPILFNIHEIPYLQPMVIGVFCGKSKPTDLNAFLNPFITELKQILSGGETVVVNNCKLTVKIRCVICDSPARSYVKGVANFNAQHGCQRCTTIGEYSYQSRTNYFTRTRCIKRNDADFREKKYGSHHKTDSPFLQLPIDMVQDFPVGDSLHLIDLGIMKRCLMGWRDGNFGNYRTKWSAAETNKISDFLLQCKMPMEIHRAVRGLDCLAFWKGLEFRTFFYYIGVVVLKSHLPHDAYQHFLMLFCAITICSSDKYKSGLDLAETLLINYVEFFGDIYGEDYITSNIHNLSHLVDDVRRFGILSNFTSYPFESKLYQIKNLLRSGNRPLVQVAKRISELNQRENSFLKNSIQTCFPVLKKELSKVNVNSFQYQSSPNKKFFARIHFSDFMLGNDMSNQWFLTHDSQIVCMKFTQKENDKITVYGASLKTKEKYFENPILSTYLNIYVSNCKENPINTYTVSDIKCKLVPIRETNTNIVFIPLIHTL